MEIYPVSDIHSETLSIKQIKRLKFPTAKICCLAGDIGTLAGNVDLDINDPHSDLGRLAYLLRHLLKNFQYLIWVPGNHEFYKTTLLEGTRGIHQLVQRIDPDRIIPLMRQYVEIDGIYFYGAPLWTHTETSNCHSHQKIVGFNNQIRNLLYQQDRDFLLSAPPGSVIISHHAPVKQADSAAHLAGPIHDCYSSNLESFMETWEGLWISGHTHYPIILRWPNGATLISNPVGYRAEHIKYSQKVYMLEDFDE